VSRYLLSKLLRDSYFWFSVFLLVITDLLFIGVVLDWFDVAFVLGPFRLNHWLGWIGFLFIALHVPIFVSLKRRYVGKIRLLLAIHVIGNLSSYLLITIHFASQISRPLEFYPDLGTGLAQYIFLITLVTTGFLQRFNILSKYRPSWRYLHKSSVLAVLVLLIFHILHGLRII
jgi:hypothetical protein